jgi:hypothetical protein
LRSAPALGWSSIITAAAASSQGSSLASSGRSSPSSWLSRKRELERRRLQEDAHKIGQRRATEVRRRLEPVRTELVRHHVIHENDVAGRVEQLDAGHLVSFRSADCRPPTLKPSRKDLGLRSKPTGQLPIGGAPPGADVAPIAATAAAHTVATNPPLTIVPPLLIGRLLTTSGRGRQAYPRRAANRQQVRASTYPA